MPCGLGSDATRHGVILEVVTCQALTPAPVDFRADDSHAVQSGRAGSGTTRANCPLGMRASPHHRRRARCRPCGHHASPTCLATNACVSRGPVTRRSSVTSVALNVSRGTFVAVPPHHLKVTTTSTDEASPVTDHAAHALRDFGGEPFTTRESRSQVPREPHRFSCEATHASHLPSQPEPARTPSRRPSETQPGMKAKLRVVAKREFIRCDLRTVEDVGLRRPSRCV